MKIILLFALVAIAAATEFYTTGNDHLNMDVLISNKANLQNYMDCFLDRKPCTELTASYKSKYQLLISNVYLLRGQTWRTKCDCIFDWLCVRSPLEEMKYLLKFILPFLRSAVEAKRGVEFCHSTRNTSRMWQKVGNGLS